MPRTVAENLLCRHIGDPTRRNVRMRLDRACLGAQETVIYRCGLHGKCAPLAQVQTLKDPAVTACCGCADYED